MGKFKYRLKIKETSSTGGSSSTTGGTGEQYGTKFAFKKKLKEEETPVKQFQQKRIEAFEEIEKKLNDLYPTLSNAKSQTIQYYQDRPTSYEIVFPTDAILELLNNIEEIIKPEEQ